MLICPTCRLNHPDGARVCLVDGTPLENIADPRIGSLVGLIGTMNHSGQVFEKFT